MYISRVSKPAVQGYNSKVQYTTDFSISYPKYTSSIQRVLKGEKRKQRAKSKLTAQKSRKDNHQSQPPNQKKKKKEQKEKRIPRQLIIYLKKDLNIDQKLPTLQKFLSSS